MIYKAGEPESEGISVVDIAGSTIKHLVEYDDETQEATVVIAATMAPWLGENRPTIVVLPKVVDDSGCHAVGTFQQLRVKVKIPGSKVVFKDVKNEG